MMQLLTLQHNNFSTYSSSPRAHNTPLSKSLILNLIFKRSYPGSDKIVKLTEATKTMNDGLSKTPSELLQQNPSDKLSGFHPNPTEITKSSAENIAVDSYVAQKKPETMFTGDINASQKMQQAIATAIEHQKVTSSPCDITPSSQPMPQTNFKGAISSISGANSVINPSSGLTIGIHATQTAQIPPVSSVISSTLLNIENNPQQTPTASSSSFACDLNDTPSTFLSEKEEIQKAVEKEILKYGASGTNGANGDLQLTKKGQELYRICFQEKIVLKPSTQEQEDTPSYDIDIEIKTPKVYTIITPHVDPETTVLTPMQKHMVAVEGHATDDPTVKGIGYLTSNSGTKVGIDGFAGPKNPMLSSQKASGDAQPQYIVPLIPPITISTDECDHLQTLDNYIQQQSVVTVLDGITTQTEKYEPKPYNTVGITVETLRIMNDLNDELQKDFSDVVIENVQLPQQTFENETDLL